MSSFLRRPPVLLALCLCSVGAVVTLLGRLVTGPSVAPKKIEISTEPGTKAYPAFSPDGSRLAYSARGATSGDDAFHIFVRDMPSGAPRQMTQGQGANDLSPAWSPDGSRIAFVRVSDESAECVVFSPAAPGEERAFPGCAAPGEGTQPMPALWWTHDGRSLVVVQSAEKQPSTLALLSLDNGTFRTITHPPAATDGDSMPVVSPDGRTLAFVRGTTSGGADIFMSDLAGAAPRRLTFDDRPVYSIAWTRDGQDLMYAGDRTGNSKLWRVPAYGGSPREFQLAGREVRYVAIAPAGNRLVYTVSPTVTSIWRAALGAATPVEHAVIRTAGRETCPRYSPDGKKIADISDQSGNDEVWLGDADGNNRVQLTHLSGPELARLRWSPDSRKLVFDAQSDHGYDLYTMPAEPGGKLTHVQLNALNGSFSHDGKSIYFQNRAHIFRASADGGSPEQLGQQPGGAQPVETVDGKYVYFRNRRSIWRVPAKGGEEEEAFIPEHDLGWATTLQVTLQGIYYFEFDHGRRETVISFFDFDAKKSDVVHRWKRMDNLSGDGGFSISPDGKTILYPRVDQSQTNLVIVENFR
jgi:Tol biopolymer transport system component